MRRRRYRRPEYWRRPPTRYRRRSPRCSPAHGQGYQRLSAQLSAFHDQFVQALNAGANHVRGRRGQRRADPAERGEYAGREAAGAAADRRRRRVATLWAGSRASSRGSGGLRRARRQRCGRAQRAGTAGHRRAQCLAAVERTAAALGQRRGGTGGSATRDVRPPPSRISTTSSSLTWQYGFNLAAYAGGLAALGRHLGAADQFLLLPL